MRIRSIKPEFWRSSDISTLAIEDRLLFIGLWSYVDDNGVGLDKLAAIAADLFADDIEADAPETFARVSRGLARLSERGRITRYTVDGTAYLHVTNWGKHQRIDKPGKARFPSPDAGSTEIRETLASLPETLAPGTGEQGNRGTGEQGNSPEAGASGGAPRKRAARATRIPDGWIPTDDLANAMAAECPTVDQRHEHRKFVDYWKAKSGKDATKTDWDATYRNWIRRAAESNPRPRATQATGNQRAQQAIQAGLDLERMMSGDQADRAIAR